MSNLTTRKCPCLLGCQPEVCLAQWLGRSSVVLQSKKKKISFLVNIIHTVHCRRFNNTRLCCQICNLMRTPHLLLVRPLVHPIEIFRSSNLFFFPLEFVSDLWFSNRYRHLSAVAPADCKHAPLLPRIRFARSHFSNPCCEFYEWQFPSALWWAVF